MKTGLSFPEKNRLHFSYEYKNFQKKSEVKRIKGMVILRMQNSKGYFRLGITIRNRAGSIGRNKIKRRIREAFRINQESLGSYDYQAIIQRDTKLSWNEISKLFGVVSEAVQKW